MKTSSILVAHLNRAHVGRAITINDSAEGLVTGELRQIFHRHDETILYLNRPFSEVPEGTPFEVTMSAGMSGIGEPIGLVEHVLNVNNAVIFPMDDGTDSVVKQRPGFWDDLDGTSLNSTITEVFHDGNETMLNGEPVKK